eukprot:symbB.v1.2.012901.t1/scaffold900.1/size153842/3
MDEMDAYVSLLPWFSANFVPRIFLCCDNAGVSPCQAAAFRGHHKALEQIAEVAGPIKPEAIDPRSVPASPTSPEVIPVIPVDVPHPGAGTTVIDAAVSEEILCRLEGLWQTLPLAPKEKASPTDRAYFDDVEGWLTTALNAAIGASKLEDAMSSVSRMRFLIYPEPGGSLPTHVDLPRYDKTGLRTSYTFLLYLSDCAVGGETTFLEALDGDAQLAPSGGVAPGERQTVGTVSPKRGRLLLMPHACPHLAAPVVEVPKVLVRGEVLPPPDHVGTAVAPVVNTAAATMTATLQDVLSGQRPMAVGQALLMWARSFALFFKGVEDCPICYNVIHLTTQTIPRKACPTCKHKFHNECLYQWFRTSSKTTCPLCNQPF